MIQIKVQNGCPAHSPASEAALFRTPDFRRGHFGLTCCAASV
ncbi:hypothetical protein METH_19070 [Leisingera methylohalidivorans DSM 14336]|uniref:Uncharacterized protein n=1 Tax=Leisingera methylohalidivorans DSM 14336 TaxID=999552 RepID=V9VX26_9RHOB|nr:hypothetical protein METH_19070 [Leisingera methylohalidivorans DSM 14336]